MMSMYTHLVCYHPNSIIKGKSLQLALLTCILEYIGVTTPKPFISETANMLRGGYSQLVH